MVICGCDPGVTGGIAFLNTDTNEVCTFALPTKDEPHGKKTRKVLDACALADLIREWNVSCAWLEHVNSFGMGRTSAFRFGEANGTIVGVMDTLGIPVALVRPQKWKAEFILSSDKKLSRERAAATWPDSAHEFERVKDSDRAEAALIALYGAMKSTMERNENVTQ